MEDFRIGRKIFAKSTNYTVTATIPADPRRVGLQMVPTNQADLSRYFSLNTVNTDGSYNCIGRVVLYAPVFRLDVQSDGQLVQSSMVFVNESGVGGCTITEYYLQDT